MVPFFREKWYIKGKGLDLGAEPPRVNTVTSRDPAKLREMES